LAKITAISNGAAEMKKPKWVVQKEQGRKQEARETVWLFGLHAVRDALMNPAREKLQLIVTMNAQAKLQEAIDFAGIVPVQADPRRFSAPLDPGSVHQGAALEVKPLNWGRLEDVCIGAEAPRVMLLDRVTDPHNVGAILRTAEVLGASAVIGTRHHSAPETGALAKTASGALERQPYLRVRNLADAIRALQSMGYLVLGLDGEAAQTIEEAVENRRDYPVALVLGAEGPGLRAKTKETVDALVRIDSAGGFGSLNVSNAAAIALYASRR
jgi:23S rRNA (guanosine2251-2'-O)-methyltransferase